MVPLRSSAKLPKSFGFIARFWPRFAMEYRDRHLRPATENQCINSSVWGNHPHTSFPLKRFPCFPKLTFVETT
jgi:hypothetical protein